MKRKNRTLTDRRQKKIIYIAAGCIAICLIAASVLFYMGRMSGSSESGKEGGGDRKEASEKSEKTETEDNGSSAGELEIPDTEIEQSSDSAGNTIFAHGVLGSAAPHHWILLAFVMER